MLDKTSEKILKSILAHIHGEQKFAFENEIYKYIHKSTPKKIIEMSLSKLADNGYINVSYSKDKKIENSRMILIPTYGGYCYFENKRHKRMEMWLKNAWIPIIVSFATTLLTNYILPKLPQIIKWFGDFLSKMIS